MASAILPLILLFIPLALAANIEIQNHVSYTLRTSSSVERIDFHETWTVAVAQRTNRVHQSQLQYAPNMAASRCSEFASPAYKPQDLPSPMRGGTAHAVRITCQPCQGHRKPAKMVARFPDEEPNYLDDFPIVDGLNIPSDFNLDPFLAESKVVPRTGMGAPAVMKRVPRQADIPAFLY